MYQASYDDVMMDDPATAKQRERLLFDRSIEMLAKARDKGPQSRESIDALYFTMRLWTILIEDLGAAENALPTSLRAGLISIGIFILKEVQKIRLGESTDYDALIEITATVRDGI
jgi:flagellar biosynthesis activator protein FlaF